MTDSESSGNICFVERHMRAARQEMQEWRNWQTRRLQVPALFFTLPGMMQKLPGRVFLFLCGEDVQTGKEKQTNLRQCKIV